MLITTDAQHPSAAKRLFLIVLAGVLTMTLGACGVHIATSPGSLPLLKGADALRDQAVRTEIAVSARASQISTRATSCPDCQKALNATAANAAARVQTLGGAWQPWGSATPKDAQMPDEVADAPLAPTDFIAWMYQTGVRDLHLAAAQSNASGQDAQTLAAIAAGRIASAQQLANVYGVSVRDGAADLSAMIKRMTATAPAYQDVSGLDNGNHNTDFGVGATESADNQSGSGGQREQMNAWLLGEQWLDVSHVIWPDDAGALAKSEALARAVTVWDCAAQTYPQTQAVAGAIEDGTLPADHLLTRVTDVLSHNVPDQRQLHCSMPSAAPIDLAQDILEADLAVFNSEESDVRAVAISYVVADAQALAQLMSLETLPAILGVSGQ